MGKRSLDVDTTKTITHLGLCAGYGGIELGLKRIIPDMRTVALCEIEAFACANLVAKMEAGLMDAAPIWSDLKTFPWAAFCDRVDLLTGGYPCQPFSSAGKRAGKDDPRHLWPWIADGIRAMRPRACFFENVEGHISMGLSDVIEDLVGMGYRVAWGIFSASEVGAPHQRKRVFVMAYLIGKGLSGLWRPQQIGLQGRWEVKEGYITKNGGFSSQVWPSLHGQPQHAWEPPRVVANAHKHRDRASIGRKELQGFEELYKESESMGNTAGVRCTLCNAPWRGLSESDEGCAAVWNPEERNQSGGELQLRSWKAQRRRAGRSFDSGCLQAESALGGDTDGAASGMDYAKLCVTSDNRTDELRLLGNGVVVATAEKAFRVLFEKLTNMNNQNNITNNTEAVETVETTETNMTEPTQFIEKAPPEQTYTVSAIAAHFDVSLPTIYRLVEKKLITPINEKNGSLKFTKSNVNSYIRSINIAEL